MGAKVNIFLTFLFAYATMLQSFNIAFLLFTLIGFTLLYKNFKVWKFTKKIPGNDFSNNLKTYFRNTGQKFHQDLNENWENFGRDKFITWIGFERFIAVSKLRDVQTVLSSTEDGLLMENYEQMWPWLGGDNVIKASGFSSNGLVSALIDGPFHKLTQSDSFVRAINKRAGEMCQQSFSRDDVIDDVKVVIRLMTFDIVYEIAMGRELPSNQRHKIFEAGEKLCQMADQQMYCGWRQSKWLLNVLGSESKVTKCHDVFTRYVRKVLNEKRDKRARVVSCLLDVLVDYRELSDDEIMSTLVGFIVLGYDRLSSAIFFALLEFSRQKFKAQGKFLREIEGNQPIDSTEKLNKLMTLDNFLIGVQRLYPGPSAVIKWIPLGIPLNGFFLPPNSSILLYLRGTGRGSQDTWKDDSFFTAQASLSDIFGGRRHEINLPMTVMKVLMGNLVKRYQLKMEEGEFFIGCGLTLRPTMTKKKFKSK